MATEGVGGAKEFHERERRRVDRSTRANFDETGVSVAGRRGWILVAATKKSLSSTRR